MTENDGKIEFFKTSMTYLKSVWILTFLWHFLAIFYGFELSIKFCVFDTHRKFFGKTPNAQKYVNSFIWRSFRIYFGANFRPSLFYFLKKYQNCCTLLYMVLVISSISKRKQTNSLILQIFCYLNRNETNRLIPRFF